jgi:hypothetical protein
MVNFCHIKLYREHLPWAGFELITLVVKDTGCISSHKSNYHTITTTTAPLDRNSAMYHDGGTTLHNIDVLASD